MDFLRIGPEFSRSAECGARARLFSAAHLWYDEGEQKRKRSFLPMHIWYINSLFGPIRLEEDGGALVGLAFDADGAPELEALPRKVCETPLLEEAEEQLNEYFAGVRRAFSLPLDARGTPFQRAVWDALCEIPYGETRTYGQIAAAIGKPNAARAVGAACHTNPIAILIPCHRVVGASGALTGYAAGVEIKEYLLTLEQG
jgi:methylated-DNA-[protein]-cysteine S-methyltransferase